MSKTVASGRQQAAERWVVRLKLVLLVALLALQALLRCWCWLCSYKQKEAAA